MLVETCVFSGDQSVDCIGRDILVVDVGAVFNVVFAYHLAVFGEEHGGLVVADVAQFVIGGQFPPYPDVDGEDEKASGTDDCQDGQQGIFYRFPVEILVGMMFFLAECALFCCHDNSLLGGANIHSRSFAFKFSGIFF